MSAELLREAIRSCRRSAFRLETRQQYAVSAEADALAAFRDNRRRQARSVRTDNYLRTVARQVIDGKDRSRVHIVSRPLSEYLRFELAEYQDSVVAGERVFIADRDAHPELAGLHDDFWLIDEGRRTERALLINYTADGEYAGCRLVAKSKVGELRAAKDAALSHAISLSAYMAEMEEMEAA
jgi:hypothetical protein